MITLIIIDCQNDFLTGTMSTKGAKNVIERIKIFIKNFRKQISKIIFTLDWHPYNHVSFKKYGGEYPHHCIQYTPGACIEPKLLKFIQSLELKYDCVLKGQSEEVDESGAFSDIAFASDQFGSRIYLDTSEISTDSEIIICGIAHTVEATILNLLNENIIPKVYVDGLVGDIKSLKQFIKDNRLETV